MPARLLVCCCSLVAIACQRQPQAPPSPGETVAPSVVHKALQESKEFVQWLIPGAAQPKDEPAVSAGAPQAIAAESAAAPLPPFYSIDGFEAALRPKWRQQDPLPSLPVDALPFYDISLEVSRTAFTVAETLYYTNVSGAPLDTLVLQLHANAVALAKGRGTPIELVGARCEPEAACAATREGSAIVLRPAAPLPALGRLLVKLALRGTLSHIESSRTSLMAQGLEGLSRLSSHTSASDYGLLAEGDGVRSLVGFYAVVSRSEGGRPVLREPSTMGDLGPDDLSHVRLLVRAPAGERVIASGVRLATDGGAELFVAPYVREAAVLTSGALQTRTRDVGGVAVRSHFLAGEQDVGARVLDYAANALQIFERRFGAYPYVDLDVVEAPLVGGAGGAEFSGLVTVASMLYRPPKVTAPAQREQLEAMLEHTVAHEVAHQYWHGLVGSDSRQTPFTDEGLAQFSALLYFEDRYGRERSDQEMQRQVADNYRLMRMLGHDDGPVDRPVADFGSELQYAGLVYGKGPLVYPELRQAVGDVRFFAALRAYVEEFAFRMAPAQALVSRLSSDTKDASVERIARRWLLEPNGDEDLQVGDVLAGQDALKDQLSSLGAGGGKAKLTEMIEQLRGNPDHDTQQLLDMLKALEAPPPP